MAVPDDSDRPVAADLESASPHEVKLVKANIESSFVGEPPELLIGLKAYQSDGLDQHLKESRGIEMITPHKRNRIRALTQENIIFRRFKRR